jgi:3-deoxy-D-manno-octulosonic-acid transferase
MRLLYRMITATAAALVYPWGRIMATRGSQRWRGRLAMIPPAGPSDLWFHAASVGEARVIGYLVDYLLQRESSLSVHITVMTPAGYRVATEYLGSRGRVSFLPLDSRSLVRRTIRTIRARGLVIAETEIWPNLVTEMHAVGLPVILVNGRMSEKAFRRYRLFAGAMKDVLACYDHLFCKTASDRQRFEFFGLSEQKIEFFGLSEQKISVVGDMKFDAPLPERSEAQARQTRERLQVAGEAFLLVAGSTRAGEEEQLVDAYRTLKIRFPHLRLVLAPRHLDRIAGIREYLKAEGLPVSLWSEGSPSAAGAEEPVVLVDRMGVLMELYQAADLAFVGGTLAARGGHNLLEPVWAGTPALFGPSLDNVIEAAEYILRHNYGARVETAEALGRVVAEVIEGRVCFAVKSEADRGDSATARVGEYILGCLSDAGKALEKNHI